MYLWNCREFKYYTVIDSTHASVSVYMPKQQWDYLRWLMAQGFDLNRFTRRLDRRRRAIPEKDIPFAEFLSFATDRLHDLHYVHHDERDNVSQPVFPHQIDTAIAKTEAFFRKSGSDFGSFHGWKC